MQSYGMITRVDNLLLMIWIVKVASEVANSDILSYMHTHIE